MLVLTRKLNEKIKIGDDITITIIKLRNNQIRIGIEAPRDVRVLRAELEKAVASGLEAADTAPASTHAAATGRPANRVRSFLDSQPVAAPAAAHLPRRNDVVDGLVSADEMIAAGKDSDDERRDDDAMPDHGGDRSPSTTLQVFSGRIGRDGELRENKSDFHVRPSRAPLAAFFTAP
ncbi:carbon storage regulator CsrA [Allorhodopirellula heiligendammensis]|uniref:Translational regulator CsrA n=1 Tax=Allorhodopirellula heiligendammensis TaxID=2714739 RepID=A0A5C6C532_9BACT|nr:carbon storage regulator CsrA [Allorhodopirellula heiligendammensis]TWU18434.1 hypothetical protein Poly21_05960 [Allorhodopirellula heiligendammensis]